jgi:Flp pilus assembly protein TadD
MGRAMQDKAFAGLQSWPRIVVLAGCTMMLGACAQSEKPSLPDLLSQNEAAAQAPQPQPTDTGKSDLAKATKYWGKEYAKDPRSLKAALNYAKDLKAMGEKKRALAVLQQASILHGNNRELASEYGRLALEFDQIGLANRLLAAADDPVNPDWRVISARGTVLAKQGKYKQAIPFFERALTFAHNHPSILSNLALAHAMNGEPKRAEAMLRQAAAADRNSLKIRQNLALVLGLQGKYDEAKLLASRDLPTESAQENTDYLRRIVKLEPNSPPVAQSPPVVQPPRDMAQNMPVPKAKVVPLGGASKVKHEPLRTSKKKNSKRQSAKVAARKTSAAKTASLLRGTMMPIPAQSEAPKASTEEPKQAARSKTLPGIEAAFSVAQWIPVTEPAAEVVPAAQPSE